MDILHLKPLSRCRTILSTDLAPLERMRLPRRIGLTSSSKTSMKTTKLFRRSTFRLSSRFYGHAQTPFISLGTTVPILTRLIQSQISLRAASEQPLLTTRQERLTILSKSLAGRTMSMLLHLSGRSTVRSLQARVETSTRTPLRSLLPTRRPILLVSSAMLSQKERLRFNHHWAQIHIA